MKKLTMRFALALGLLALPGFSKGECSTRGGGCEEDSVLNIPQAGPIPTPAPAIEFRVDQASNSEDYYHHVESRFLNSDPRIDSEDPDYGQTRRPRGSSPEAPSAPTAPTVPTKPTPCFSGAPGVQVRDRGTVPMKDLKVGDHVLVGKNKFQPIYAFGHMDRERQVDYLQFTVVGRMGWASETLEVSAEHLLFLKSNKHPVRADSIRVGDVLEGNDAPLTVKWIRRVHRRGLYAPFTEDGVLIVNGVTASSYVSLQREQQDITEYVHYKGGTSTGLSQHAMAHMGLAPLRMICLGLSSSMCEKHDQDGKLVYVSRGLGLAKWLHESNVWIQILGFNSVLALVLPFVIAESIFGASWAPVGLLATGLSFLALWSFGGRIRHLRKNKTD